MKESNKLISAVLAAVAFGGREDSINIESKSAEDKILARDNSRFIGLKLPKKTHKRNKKTGY